MNDKELLQSLLELKELKLKRLEELNKKLEELKSNRFVWKPTIV
jgi:predicted transcriptional regulator